MQGFFDITTCHGLADLNRAPGLKIRVFWLVTVLATFGTLISFVFEVIYEYNNAGMMTSIYTVSRDSMKLPEVSLCYSLAFDPVKAENIGIPPDLIKALLKRFRLADPTILLTNDTQKSNQLEQFLNSTVFRGPFESFMKSISFTCNDLLIKVFSTSKDVMKNTTDLCKKVNYYAHPHRGYCLILPQIRQSWPCYYGGWNILLAIPSYPHEYRSIEHTTGFAVAFSKKIIAPMFKEVMLPAGHHSSIFIEPIYHTKIQYLSWPRKSSKMCRHDQSKSSSACYFKCWSKSCVQACGCASFGFSYLINATTCWPFREGCNAINYQRCQQKCLPACETWEFKTAVSYSVLNRLAIINDYFDDYSTGGENSNSQEFASASISYSDMKYEVIAQKEAITLQMTISNVGGQLGLWMGISVITILQAFCYAGGHLIFCMRNIMKRQDTPATQIETKA